MQGKTITTAAIAAGLLTATAGTAAAAPAATAPASAAATRQVEGTVRSVDRSARTFRLRDSERGTFRIKVTRNTRFERIGGFAGLHKGLSRVEATIVRRDGRWVARSVERSGGGDRHGGGGGDD